jgi:pyruvate dehydrogenase E2 component (dihydrolipoamide acetyltransferase)
VEHPVINSQFIENAIHRYHDADISVIVAVDGGLATPVIRGANRKSLREIAAEVKALSARAVAGKLRMDEILGGTFSISNLGAFGVDRFDAIINAPQCAILAVGRSHPRIVVSENAQAGIASVLSATLSVDHRAIDGVEAAAFLTTLRRVLETPQVLFSADAGVLPS